MGALHMGAYGLHVGHWVLVCTWCTWRTLHIGAGREHMSALHMGVWYVLLGAEGETLEFTWST